MVIKAPGAKTLAAFGAPAEAVRLPGGQGTTWRAEKIILKPAGDPVAAAWTAGLYRTLSGPGFRVPMPVPSADGGWVADGWVAWQMVPGEPAPVARWPELVRASRAFHAALAGMPAPRWLGRDGSQWTVAGQVAWSERDPASFTVPDLDGRDANALYADGRGADARGTDVWGADGRGTGGRGAGAWGTDGPGCGRSGHRCLGY